MKPAENTMYDIIPLPQAQHKGTMHTLTVSCQQKKTHCYKQDERN